MDPILKGKYPAKEHCAKVTSYLKSKHDVSETSVIYLKGQKTKLWEDNDEPQPFRCVVVYIRTAMNLTLGQPTAFLFLPQWLRSSR